MRAGAEYYASMPPGEMNGMRATTGLPVADRSQRGEDDVDTINQEETASPLKGVGATGQSPDFQSTRLFG